MLARVDQLLDVDRFFDVFDRFDDRRRRPTARSLPLDAYRRGDTFYLHFDVPGIDPDAIEMTVDGDVLTVRADRRWAEEDGDEVVVRERPQGAMERQVLLGDTLDRARVEARCEHGVLTVRVPVRTAPEPHRIPITGRGGTDAPEAGAGDPPPASP